MIGSKKLSNVWVAVILMVTVKMARGLVEKAYAGEAVSNDLLRILPSSPTPLEDLYDEAAAEDMWARVQALNTLAPEFQGQNNTEVLAQVGGDVKFSCYTYHLSDEMVTWLKRDDDYLITIGQEVYATETRYSVVHSDYAEAWDLWIKDVHPSDAGQYECQLTTYPPVSFFFNLVVTRSEAVIHGPKEVHIEEGSHLSIECQVLRAPVPPTYIFWYHNNSMVNYGRQQAVTIQHSNYSSTLTLTRVRATDAGTWKCDPYLATPANVTVHVVSGKQPAAMKHGPNQGDGKENNETKKKKPVEPSSNSGVRNTGGTSLLFLALLSSSCYSTWVLLGASLLRKPATPGLPNVIHFGS